MSNGHPRFLLRGKEAVHESDNSFPSSAVVYSTQGYITCFIWDFVLNYFITNWVANWLISWNWVFLGKPPAAQQLKNFTTICKTLKYYYSTHMSPLVPILSQMNPVHTTPSSGSLGIIIKFCAKTDKNATEMIALLILAIITILLRKNCFLNGTDASRKSEKMCSQLLRSQGDRSLWIQCTRTNRESPVLFGSAEKVIEIFSEDKTWTLVWQADSPPWQCSCICCIKSSRVR
jgi:hypothetical protein